jgi:hypothetical protein
VSEGRVQSQKSFRREYKKEAFSMHTRRILLFTVLLLMTPALAMGSTARLEGLGVIPDFVDDYANIFAYPVSITRYPGVVFGELGAISTVQAWDEVNMKVVDVNVLWGRGFGATMGLGQDNAYGVFGITLRENSGFAPIPDTRSIYDFPWGTMGSQFDLIWGMNFGKASFGIRLDNSSSEFEEPKVEKDSPWSYYYLFPTDLEEVITNEVNSMGAALSVGLEVREADKIEATFEYRTLNFSADYIAGDWKLEDQGNPSYGFTGRGFFSVAENMTVVPLFSYNKYDYSAEIKSVVPDLEDSADQTLANLRAGLGLKVDVGSMFMVGLGFSQTKAKIEYSYAEAAPVASLVESFELTSTSLPFFFGCLETQVKDWLAVRFGARKNLVNEKLVVEEVGPTKFEYETKNGLIPDDIREDFGRVPVFQEPFVFSLGVGFKFGDLDIDATLNDAFPFTGMYWLSGDAMRPFGRISATYHY